MGQTCSTIDQVKDPTDKIVQSPYLKLGYNFSFSKWEAAHNTGSIMTLQDEIEEVTKGQPFGCDLRRISSLPNEHRKCIFICCNTYTKPEYSLGVGPINDTLAIASFMRKIGFQIFFILNPTSNEFLHYFKHFIGCTKEYLVVYYVGHGGYLEKTNTDSEKVKNEAFIFDEDYVTDNILSEAIANSGKPESSTVCLISDCCHYGTIYDFKSGHFKEIRMPLNIYSISSSRNYQISKQSSVGDKDHGIFSFYFFRLLMQDPDLTPISMEQKINQYLSKYNQKYVFSATSPEILDKIFFQ